MVNKSYLQNAQVSSSDYRSRTPSYYLEKIEPYILASFNPEQLEAVTFALSQAIPKPSPKVVDFKFVIDLVFQRFYVVLFVGKELRRKQRQHAPEGIARAGNVIAAAILLIGTNMVISALILLFVYLLKSAIGINFFPGHISETFRKYF